MKESKGVFFKVAENNYKKFLIAVVKSKYKREEIFRKLIDLFNEKGDKLFKD